MNTKATPAMLVVLAAILALLVPAAAAQVPDTLKYTLDNPGTSPQEGTGQGYSVAVDGDVTVVGAPFDDLGGFNSGAVKVYHTATGALLHVLVNPSPAYEAGFGSSVAVSGTRVAVGTHYYGSSSIGPRTVYVYDLSSASPTVPIATLHSPSSYEYDAFGGSVAVSGTRVVVGASGDDSGAVASGSVYVYDLSSATPTVPVTKIENPKPAFGHSFGSAVAVSGAQVVVGAHYHSDSAAMVGRAYVYDLSSATPKVPVATLNNPSPEGYDSFGSAVAISGMRVVIGASGDNTGAPLAGTVYVYDLSSTKPTVPMILNNPTPELQDQFGFSVSVNGTRVVVGANGDGTGEDNAGSVYVYDLSSATPKVPVATVHSPGPTYFGSSVAVSGTRVVVGASNADSAYVYNLSLATPTVPAATLNSPSPGATHEYFGSCVRVSGMRVVVGAPWDDTDGVNSGSVYVYDLSSATPTVPVVRLSNPSTAGGAQFGSSVAVSGALVVVGATGDDTGATDAGSVYVYDVSSGTPAVPLLTLHNPSPEEYDFFGGSVGVSGTRVVVGADNDDTSAMNSGSVYVYDLSSGTPTVPAVTLNNPSPAANDNFGVSVAISGTHLVIGANGDDTGANPAGSAYVYDLSSGTPTLPLVTLNNPTPEDYDNFGGSVAISGTRVVIGASSDNTGKDDAGSVYVYDISSPMPTVPIATLNNPSPADRDHFGSSVAVSGMRVVVGLPRNFTGTRVEGRAYIYDLSSPAPTVPVATLGSPSPELEDYFGTSVAIDDTTVIVGATQEDGITVDRGVVYVFGVKGPVAGTFAVTPASPAKPTTTFTATFSNWTDVNLPLTYEVRSSSGIVVPAGNNPSPTFLLPAGTHSLTGRIYNSQGDFTDAGLVTIVVDGNAPVITAPGNITAYAASPAGKAVHFSFSVLDDVDSSPTVSVVPPSGSSFPLGTTTVTVMAQDDAGNVASVQFNVTVVPADVKSLYTTGNEVPGSESDKRIQPGSVWNGFGSPAINNAGQVAYIGKWTSISLGGPRLSPQAEAGIFVDDLLIEKVGDPVPGLNGVHFKAFKDPVIDDAGHVAFIAIIAGSGVNSGSDTVIVSNGRTGEIEVLAREGGQAEGTGGATFKAFANVSIKGGSTGGTLFTASLRPGTGRPTVTARNDTGAWWLPAGDSGVIKLVREGDPFGEQRIHSFLLLNTLTGSPGQGRGQNDADSALLRLTLTRGKTTRQTQVLAQPGTLEEYAGTGQLLGGVALPAATWGTMNLPTSGNLGTNVSVLGGLARNALIPTAAKAAGIFVSGDAGTTWEPLARAGDAAPGLASGEVFDRFKDPANSSTDAAVSFMASAKGKTLTKADNDGIWYAPDGVNLELVAREGGLPVDAPEGAQWKSFTSLAQPGGGIGPLFTAFLQKGTARKPHPSGITNADDFALYAVDSTGALQQLIRENQPLLNKTVQSFRVLQSESGSAGVGRSYNASGQVALLVNFTDASTAIVRIGIP